MPASYTGGVPPTWNFSAGPAILPRPVLEEIQTDFLNFDGTGSSLLEQSHRSQGFMKIRQTAEERFRKLLAVPDDYAVLFLQGGATLQFTQIPLAFGSLEAPASYWTTGSWSEKALASARLNASAIEAFSSKGDGFRTVPTLESPSSGVVYSHFCSNETIQGVEFADDPPAESDWVCDMSSNIASRPLGVSRYALIYAGAQKNLGPAGLTLVIVRRSFLAKQQANLPPVLNYREQDAQQSMVNTPPTFAIYVASLVAQYWLDRGGLAHVAAENKAKSALLYRAIDESDGFYVGHAEPTARSRMNVVFRLPNESLTAQFLQEAALLGMQELKGHRSVGGCRASIYNAFPPEGCEALASFMYDFRRRA